MKVLLKPQPAQREPNKAIKTPLKIGLVGVFLLIGLFLIFIDVLATTIYEEGFEPYATASNLNGQGGWTTCKSATKEYFISETDKFKGLKSLTRLSQSGIACSQQSVATSTADNVFSFAIKPNISSDNSASRQTILNISFSGPEGTNDIFLKFETIDYFGGRVGYYTGPNGTTTENWITIDRTQWAVAKIYFSNANDEVKFEIYQNGSTWKTAWLDTGRPIDYLNLIQIYNEVGYAPSYVDNLILGIYCPDFLDSYSCQNAGCAWYYSAFVGGIAGNWGYYCTDAPVGECAEGVFDCQNCLTQENCEGAGSYCYWHEGICKYGTGACGEGLELQFCENKEDCEGAGGYWYDDFCWLSAPPSLLDWDEYYSEFGDYATASEWITAVASSTTGFFGTIGSFTGTFKNFFDLKEAQANGAVFGSVIPLAFGYLAIINQFTGGLPVATLFLFILGFMLAIGVFRIVRNLVQLIKFW